MNASVRLSVYVGATTARVTQERGQHTRSSFSILSEHLHRPSAVLAFPFTTGRVQRFLSLVDRKVEACVPTAFSLSTFGYDVITDRVATPRFEPTSQPLEVSEAINVATGGPVPLIQRSSYVTNRKPIIIAAHSICQARKETGGKGDNIDIRSPNDKAGLKS